MAVFVYWCVKEESWLVFLTCWASASWERGKTAATLSDFSVPVSASPGHLFSAGRRQPASEDESQWGCKVLGVWGGRWHQRVIHFPTAAIENILLPVISINNLFHITATCIDGSNIYIYQSKMSWTGFWQTGNKGAFRRKQKESDTSAFKHTAHCLTAARAAHNAMKLSASTSSQLWADLAQEWHMRAEKVGRVALTQQSTIYINLQALTDELWSNRTFLPESSNCTIHQTSQCYTRR